MGLALVVVVVAWLPAAAAPTDPLDQSWVCDPVPGGVRCVSGDEVILCPDAGVGRHECRDLIGPTDPPSDIPSEQPSSPPTAEPTEPPSPTPSASASASASPQPSDATTEATTPTPTPTSSVAPSDDPTTPPPSDDPTTPPPDPDPDPDPDPSPDPRPDPDPSPSPSPTGDGGWVGATVLSADGHTGINGPASVSTSLITVEPGDHLVLTGGGWLPGSTLRIVLHSAPVLLGTAEVDSNGNFRTQVTVPEDLAVGEHHLVVSGLDENGVPRQVTIPLTAISAGDSDQPGQVADANDDVGALPATGGTPAVLAVEALAALVVGALLVLTAARSDVLTPAAARPPARRRSRSG
jgi:hypothetical protein